MFMNAWSKLYQYINILSLDVVSGAVISALFFGRIFHVTVSLYALAALALTVWAIYTIDHLRDAKAIRSVASTDRHRFHQNHFKVISVAVVLIMAIDFVLIWFVPREVLIMGSVLWLIVLAYLATQRYLKFLKEFFVALLYTVGILLPSLAVTDVELHGVHYVLIAKFFITALMNLLLFSLYDHNEDRSQQQHSFVTWFGPASTRIGILLLALLNILSGILIWSFDPAVALIFIAMNLMLLAILVFQKQLARNNYYRMVGDAVFFVPVVYLL